jgi:hypothetical protein
VCFSAQLAVAQEDDEEKITISVSMYDKLRSDVKYWNDSTTVLLDSCNKLNGEITLLKETIALLNGEIKNNANLSKIIAEKDSFIIVLQNQHKADSSSLKNVLLQLNQMQETADKATAQYANGRLYFKYDAERIEKCLKDFESLKTPSVKETFNQMPNLLKNYGNYSAQLKLLLQSAQNDPDRKARNKADEYRAKYVNLIHNLSYYSSYYAKKNTGTWSIPYLNNIIDVALSILQKHDPGHNDPVNFNPLIEML